MTNYCAKCGDWAPLDTYTFQCGACLTAFYGRPASAPAFTPERERTP